MRLEDEKRDAWGVPVLHGSMTFGDHERRLCKDMSEQAAELLEAAGACDYLVERFEKDEL